MRIEGEITHISFPLPQIILSIVKKVNSFFLKGRSRITPSDVRILVQIRAIEPSKFGKKDDAVDSGFGSVAGFEAGQVRGLYVWVKKH